MRGIISVPGRDTAVQFQNLHPALRIDGVSCPRSTHRSVQTVDLPRPRNLYGVHNNSVVNLARGINERIFYIDAERTEVPKPTVSFHEKLGAFERDLKSFHIPALNDAEFLATYSGGKLRRYQAAVESLKYEPLRDKDAYLTTFLKAEKIDFSEKPDPAPRVIQPRNPRFGVEFGKYIKAMEHPIYKALARLNKYPCVAKGFNAVQLGDIIAKKWKLFKQPAFVSLDMKRFDQHVSVEALKWTHAVYRRFNSDDSFLKILSMMYDNAGVGVAKDGIVRYKKKGGRCSGDMDTALGNCVLMVGMTYALLKSLGITGEIIDNGDDCTVIMESRDVTRFEEACKRFYKQLGFQAKIEACGTRLEKLEFCQMQPVYDGCRWVMCRQIKALSKDLTTVFNKDNVRAWMRAIGDCGLALTDGIPVFSAFYRRLQGMGARSKVTDHPMYSSGMSFLARGLNYHCKPITPLARVSFYAAFGIAPDMQIALEEGFLTGPNDNLTSYLHTYTTNSCELFDGTSEEGITCAQEFDSGWFAESTTTNQW